MIIALEAEELLKDLGAVAVTVAATVQRSLAALMKHKFDAALLDVNLGAESSAPVAAAWLSAGIPFAFATGYGEGLAFRHDYPDAPVVSKPTTPRRLPKPWRSLASDDCAGEKALRARSASRRHGRYSPGFASRRALRRHRRRNGNA